MATILTPTKRAIEKAAEFIRAGGLVAFPTETVYGLGANALDREAVQRIFLAKGRPAANPLIVHIANASAVATLAHDVEWAHPLIERFWPGPLTLVFQKQPVVPDIVTGGGPTVAIRMPKHPVALALLEAAGTPIAAPSANRSESISPTRAEHVALGLGDSIDLILDGGACEVGLESTVLDVSTWPPRLLRPGMVSREELESVLGATISVSGYGDANTVKAAQRSPGQMPRHYAPATPLTIHSDIWHAVSTASVPVAVIAVSPPPTALPPTVQYIPMPSDPVRYASSLYESLHTADQMQAAAILVEDVPGTPAWDAIRDRLNRAAAS